MKEELADMLTTDEGLRLKVYDDHNGEPIKKGSKVEGYPTLGVGRELSLFGITEEEARYLLINDIARVLKEAEAFPWWNNLNEPRKICVANMLFNLGLTRFNQFKNFQTRLEESNWPKAADEMMDSRWATQVKTRAQRLEKIMRSGQLLT
jgi:lysozyme